MKSMCKPLECVISQERQVEGMELDERQLDGQAEDRTVVRDASGRANGVLIEAAMEAVEGYVRARLAQEEQLSMIQAATRQLNSHGITSVVNAAGELAEIKLYAAL